MSSNEERKKMEEMVTCSVCLELYNKPKLLACQHSYCEACLQQMHKLLINGAYFIKCPDCNHLTLIPPQGISNLNPDFRSQQIKDLLDGKGKKKSEAKEKQGRLCDMCIGEAVSHEILCINFV